MSNKPPKKPNQYADGTYPVGKGKPPKSGQFTKGRSGNIKGRPKGIRNFRTDFEDAMGRKVIVYDPVKRKEVKMTVREALLQVTTQMGLKGNLKATELVVSLQLRYDLQDQLAREFPHIKGAMPAYKEEMEMDHKKMSQAIKTHLNEGTSSPTQTPHQTVVPVSPNVQYATAKEEEEEDDPTIPPM